MNNIPMLSNDYIFIEFKHEKLNLHCTHTTELKPYYPNVLFSWLIWFLKDPLINIDKKKMKMLIMWKDELLWSLYVLKLEFECVVKICSRAKLFRCRTAPDMAQYQESYMIAPKNISCACHAQLNLSANSNSAFGTIA